MFVLLTMMQRIFQLGLKLYVRFFCKIVGNDQYGNIYYETKKAKNYWGNQRRLCIFKGTPEASKIPAEWYTWIHNLTDKPIPTATYPWILPHLSTLTRSIFRYTPNAWLLSRRNKSKADSNATSVSEESTDNGIFTYKVWRPYR